MTAGEPVLLVCACTKADGERRGVAGLDVFKTLEEELDALKLLRAFVELDEELKALNILDALNALNELEKMVALLDLKLVATEKGDIELADTPSKLSDVSVSVEASLAASAILGFLARGGLTSAVGL